MKIKIVHIFFFLHLQSYPNQFFEVHKRYLVWHVISLQRGSTRGKKREIEVRQSIIINFTS